MVKPNVIIYSMSDCPFCERAKSILKDMKVEYDERNISVTKYREELVKRSNDDKLPTIIVNDTVLVKPGEDKLRATINYEKHRT